MPSSKPKPCPQCRGVGYHKMDCSDPSRFKPTPEDTQGQRSGEDRHWCPKHRLVPRSEVGEMDHGIGMFHHAGCDYGMTLIPADIVDRIRAEGMAEEAREKMDELCRMQIGEAFAALHDHALRGHTTSGHRVLATYHGVEVVGPEEARPCIDTPFLCSLGTFAEDTDWGHTLRVTRIHVTPTTEGNDQ